MKGLIGKVLGDKYAIRRLLGEGGMGAVYVAEHMNLGSDVAVKVLHPRVAQDREAASRLRHEARVAGTLGHPNICAVYDLGKLDDGRPYVVMERLRGETLGQRMTRTETVSYPELVDILSQVLSALAAAHKKNVIHRDLKPDNIFLSERPGMLPIPKLLDFGMSTADGIEDTCADLSESGPAAGTPFYMAPEVARGDRQVDHRQDLWALGVILYEALTGKRPFQAKNYNALLMEILRTTPVSLRTAAPWIPAGLVVIIEKAMEKAPDQRYATALEFQSALRRFKQRERPSAGVMISRAMHEEESDDATTVFVRSELGDQEDTSRTGEPHLLEGDLTIVDPPSFDLTETNVIPRPPTSSRGRKS